MQTGTRTQKSVEKGDAPPMAPKNSNIKDVARRAGVSTATVSHVLNHTKTVSEETRRRVLKAVEGLQYQPNQQARQLRLNRRLDVLVVVEEACMESAVAASLLAGLIPALQQRCGNVVTSFFSRPEQMEALLRRGVYYAAYVLSSRSMAEYRSVFGESVLFLNFGLGHYAEYVSDHRQIDLGAFFYREIESCLRGGAFSHIMISYAQGNIFKKIAADAAFDAVRLMSSEISSGAYALQQALEAGGGHILFADHALFLGAVKHLLQHESILCTHDLEIEYLPWAKRAETYGMPLAVRPLPMEAMLRHVLAQPFPD